MTLSRRDFLKITALAGVAVGMGTTIQQFLANGTGSHKVSETHQLMGTIVNFVLIAESDDQAHVAIQQTVAEMRRLIQMYDYRQPESQLGQLNGNGVSRHAPAELIATVRQSLDLGRLSHGAFDITVLPLLDALRRGQPSSEELRKRVDYRLLTVSSTGDMSFSRPGMAITLDGIAKGSVVDGGVAMLRKQGFSSVLVEAGGDMMAKGSPPGDGWKIGIAHPRHSTEYIATVSIQDQAVATSGDYLNYFSPDFAANHIIDPRTGRSPMHLASATVIAPTAAEADALSTTMMVLGVQNGLSMIDQLPGTAALLVTKDMTVYRSSKFPSE